MFRRGPLEKKMITIASISISTAKPINTNPTQGTGSNLKPSDVKLAISGL